MIRPTYRVAFWEATPKIKNRWILVQPKETWIWVWPDRLGFGEVVSGSNPRPCKGVAPFSALPLRLQGAKTGRQQDLKFGD